MSAHRDFQPFQSLIHLSGGVLAHHWSKGFSGPKRARAAADVWKAKSCRKELLVVLRELKHDSDADLPPLSCASSLRTVRCGIPLLRSMPETHSSFVQRRIISINAPTRVPTRLYQSEHVSLMRPRTFSLATTERLSPERPFQHQW
jgi:hypothetical protein